MIQVKTKSGFECELQDNVLNNMELVDAIAELDERGSLFALSKLCILLLGEAQRRRLYDHLRTEDGRVPNSDVEREVVEILRGCGKAGKNSVPSPE